MKPFIMFAVAAALMCVTPVFAENAQITNMQILIDKVKADKKLLIASNMDLTDKESKGFLAALRGLSKRTGTFKPASWRTHQRICGSLQ